MRTINKVMRARAARIVVLSLMLAITMGLFVARYSLPVYAHGESIQVSPTEAKPGESVTITGEEFPPGEEVELMLEGVRGSVPLGHAEADDSGAFLITIGIPESILPGSYQLVATTADDNVTSDFTVLERGPESRAEEGTILVFQRSTSEVIAIGLITVALILGGAFLVVSGSRRHT